MGKIFRQPLNVNFLEFFTFGWACLLSGAAFGLCMAAGSFATTLLFGLVAFAGAWAIWNHKKMAVHILKWFPEKTQETA